MDIRSPQDHLQAGTSTSAVPLALVQLQGEHELIRRLLHALENWLDDERQSPQVLKELTRFFREFIVGVHLLKEESLLFPIIKRYGIGRGPSNRGPLFDEHEESKAILAALEASCEHEAWQLEEAIQVKSAARRYLVLLRNHMSKEESIFYPMLAQRLPKAAWDELNDKFEALEEERECTGHQAEIAELTRRFLNHA